MKEKWSKEKIKKEVIEWLFCLIVAYILYLILNYFIGTVSGVKQISMKPTANEGEKVLIQRNILSKKELKYGDIITFTAPSDNINITEKESGKVLEGNEAIANFDEYTGIDSFIYNFIGLGKRSYIKRVIGVAGDHVVINDDGSVYKNDEMLEEAYIKDGTTSKNGAYFDVIVPAETVFVMGDNRLQSMDSRYFGCVPLSKIDGYVISRVWPLNKMGELK